jgi:hypothetical protein
MRRHPSQHWTPPQGGYDATPDNGRPKASELGGLIEPFLVGGGQTFWQLNAIGGLDPRPAGVQLLAAHYVPLGQMGFIKRIVAAPTVPAVIGDAFRNGLTWWDAEAVPGQFPGDGNRANSHSGLWETPLAWQGFFENELELVSPEWHWQITLVKGDWQKERESVTLLPYSASDPSTWYLVRSRPVNLTANFQFPGTALAGNIGTQEIPVLPRDPMSVHWPVPENSSVLLWAWWRQAPMELNAGNANGGGTELAENVYPLGPSIGQLGGYTQPIQSPAACDNAEVGWGG